MTKTKSTKRALLLSALSLLMCVSMLIGSTFAWFTDSATSGNNKIVAGTLDVDLLMAGTNGTYTSIAGKDAAIFGEGSLAQDNAQQTLWEPGKTQIVYLAVENKGNLDLKYNILLNVVDGGLIGSLEYVIVDGAKYGDINTNTTSWATLKATENVQTGNVVAGTTVAAPNGAITVAEKTEYFALAVHMKEEAGNEYQGKDITIDVTVLATQLASESDSFNNQYDKDATFGTVVSTVDELNAALKSAQDGDTIYLAAVDFGNVDLYNGTVSGHRYEYANYYAKNVTIIGQNGTSFSKLRLGENDTTDVVMTGWAFKNIGFTGDGLVISMNNKDVTVENCTFTGTELLNTGTSTYQAVNFTVNDCTFNGSHATRNTQIAIQNSNGVTVTGCTFTNAAYSAINMTEIHGNVTIDGNTINGTANRPLRFAISESAATLNIKNNTIVSGGNADGELMKADGAVTAGNITLSGNTWNGKADSAVTAGMNGSDYIVKYDMVSTVDELKAALKSAQDGDTIYLAAVDFGNVDLYNGTVSGHRYEHADYTVKNITIVGQNGTSFSKLRLGENDTTDVVMTGWTFKNIAFANGDGLLLSMNNSDVTLDNCTFTNTEIQAAGADCISKNLTISECTFDGSHATRKTQLHIQGSEGLTVIGCTFTDGLYNAMALSDIRGDVTIDDNTITGSTDRAFRFSGVGANVSIVVKNNKITDSAREKEGKYQVICIGNNDGVPATSSITFTGNTYNGTAWAEGMVIANTTVETIICSDNTRIDG